MLKRLLPNTILGYTTLVIVVITINIIYPTWLLAVYNILYLLQIFVDEYFHYYTIPLP